ncbi:hypothetical protein SISNIDRAFT_463184 [Sistotremastrum niveocremeum HHB9708]|uniref:Fungal lipase-type domain-containing protein n=1 Tax=Sistotremastrum niveocremeum HHB9708 TaxID=1314777 RepID=A0A164YUQ4_9AGAM|nr:hypothetical protein SISNIDRAFT_463184 [Sistotremastrum niveocremeum HHB9708]
MAAWDIYQQTFALSLASNALGAKKAPLADLQNAIESAVPNWIRKGASQGLKGYEVVWGPTVWKHTLDGDANTGPDNTWYIANNKAAVFPDGTFNTYVIAIAGTASSFGWTDEDFQVGRVVDINQFAKNFSVYPSPDQSPNDAANSYIAFGTAIGVHTLLNTVAPATAKSPGTTIVSILSSIPSGSRVIFTGHSLGGALSPTAALVLQLSKGLSNVYTYPTAGATPGNLNFVKLFASKNPPSTPGSKVWQAWNRNVYNTLDVVPQAWSIDKKTFPNQNLHHVPTMWGTLPSGLANALAGLIFVAVGMVNPSNIKYIPLPGQTFTSTLPSIPQNFDEWKQVAHTEHVPAYMTALGVNPDGFVAGKSALSVLPEKTLDELIVSYPFLELLGRFPVQIQQASQDLATGGAATEADPVGR